MDDLTEQIAAIAGTVPPALLEAIAAAFEASADPGPKTRARISNAISQPHVRGKALELADTWGVDTTAADGPGIARALRAAAKAVEAVRGAQAVELVWTGPQSSVSMRQTRQALRDVCRQAERTLILSSFSTSNIGDLADDLAEAVARDVDVVVILETTQANAQNVDGATASAFAVIEHAAAFYEWPQELRPGAYAAMHVKAAMSDSHNAFISSANLSGAALDRNMELGVLIVGEPLPGQLERHFRGLINADVLRPVTT